MKLYYFGLSPYSQKVMIALFEKGISVDFEEIDLFSDEEVERQKLADFKALYPLGRLPVLVDGDKYIGESTMIVEYIEGHGEQRLIPDDAQLAWQARYYSVMADNYITESARTLFFQYQRPAEKQNQQAIKRAQETLLPMYAQFAKALDGQDKFLLGEKFTLADCAAWPALKLANRLFPFVDQYPQLHDYTSRLAEHKGIAKMLEFVKG